MMGTLFLTFFLIGLFTIGGGYAMIPMISQEVVETHGFMSLEQLTDFFAVAESTPGPFAVNTATFVGMNTLGLEGALAATCGVVLPSFLIILMVAKWFARFEDNLWVQAALYGMSSVVVGLIATAVLHLGQTVFYAPTENLIVDVEGVLICGLCLFLHLKLKWGAIPLLLVSGSCGIVVYGLIPMII